jgi:hypothetical protein
VEELLEFVQCLPQHRLQLLIGECLRPLTTLAHLLGAGTATLRALLTREVMRICA